MVFFSFWADTRGQDALLGLPLFWGPVDGPANGAYFQTLSTAIKGTSLFCRRRRSQFMSKLTFVKWKFGWHLNLGELPLGKVSV